MLSNMLGEVLGPSWLPRLNGIMSRHGGNSLDMWEKYYNVVSREGRELSMYQVGKACRVGVGFGQFCTPTVVLELLLHAVNTTVTPSHTCSHVAVLACMFACMSIHFALTCVWSGW